MANQKREVKSHYEVINGVAETLGVPKVKAAQAYKAVLEEVVRGLNSGRSVNLPGYFRFDLVDVAPRKAHNPQNPAETFMTKPKVTVKLRRLKKLNEVSLHVEPKA